MARRSLGVLAVVVVLAAVAAAVAVSERGGKSPATPAPGQALPSQQQGDTADLMRRLERKKHLKGVR